jgi:hypothetical protein
MHDDPGAHEPIRQLGSGLAGRLARLVWSVLAGRPRPRAPEPASRPAPRLLVVEILGFEEQDSVTQAVLRVALGQLIAQALDDSAIDLRRVTASELVSIVVLEAESQSVALELLCLFAPRLAMGLAQYNRDAPAAVQILVRAGIDVSGPCDEPAAGTAEQLAFLLEMLTAQRLPHCVPSTSRPMVLLATGWRCDNVRRDSDHAPQARCIQYECAIAANGTDIEQRVWLRIPGSPRSILATSSLRLLADLPVSCAILAVDMEAYGDRARLDPERAAMRRKLRRLLEEIVSEAGMRPLSIGDQGDELLLVFSPETSDIRLINPVVTTLASRLAQYNPTVPPRGSIRIRAVVDRCYLTHDGGDVLGQDLNTAHRLLNSRALHRSLAEAKGPVALIISDELYQRLVRHGYDGVDSAAFQRVRINEKETRTHAWISLPSSDAGDADDGPSRRPL